MAHRVVLTERQRTTIFSLATDAHGLLRHYTLADDDLAHIQFRRRPRNRFGFALAIIYLANPLRMRHRMPINGANNVCAFFPLLSR
jgi:hypothetical protein